jgi:methionine-R-sulfoxide reductase
MGLMSYIGEQFHRPTGIGGRLATGVMNRQNWRQYVGTESVLALCAADSVLDIGFGNGYMLNRLAGRHNCRFYGIDISPDMLEAATSRNKKHIDDGRMSLALGSAEQTGLAAGLIGKAYTVNTVYFWSSLDAGLQEMGRVLKPGGVLVNTVYAKAMLDRLPVTRSGYAKYEIDELLTAGERNGFFAQAQPIVAGRSYCIIYRKEEYHQNYLDKNPQGYCHIPSAKFASASCSEITPVGGAEDLREKLTPMQFEVAINGATEPPFQNEYFDHFKAGIYVDIVSGVPLFVSTDKFASGCGWPAFAKPINEALLQTLPDRSYGRQRTEVRSAPSGIHLGHVFDDGIPERGGLRYCINSAALRFVPLEHMEREGYREYLPLIMKNPDDQ